MNRAEVPEPDRARDQRETAVEARERTDLEAPSTDVATSSFYDDWFFDDGARS